MADQKQSDLDKIEAITKAAITAQEKAGGQVLNATSRAAIRSSVEKVYRDEKGFAETISTGITSAAYGIDGGAITNTVRLNGGVINAAKDSIPNPVELAKVFKEAGLKSGALSTLVRGAPLINVGIASYDVATADTTRERAQAAGGFIGATAAAASFGLAAGTVIPGAGNVAGFFIGAAAGAGGYLLGRVTGGWIADKITPEKGDLSKKFETANLDKLAEPAPAEAPSEILRKATATRTNPVLESTLK